MRRVIVISFACTPFLFIALLFAVDAPENSTSKGKAEASREIDTERIQVGDVKEQTIPPKQSLWPAGVGPAETTEEIIDTLRRRYDRFSTKTYPMDSKKAASLQRVIAENVEGYHVQMSIVHDKLEPMRCTMKVTARSDIQELIGEFASLLSGVAPLDERIERERHNPN